MCAGRAGRPKHGLGIRRDAQPGIICWLRTSAPFAGTIVPELHGAVVEVFLGQAGRDCGRALAAAKKRRACRLERTIVKVHRHGQGAKLPGQRFDTVGVASLIDGLPPPADTRRMS